MFFYTLNYYLTKANCEKELNLTILNTYNNTHNEQYYKPKY